MTRALLLATVVAGGCTSPAVPLDLGERETFRLARGVIVDARAGTVYAMTDRPGLEALRARDGVIVWGNNHVSEPLLVAGDIVVAAVEPRAATPHELPLALIRSSHRGKIFHTATLELTGGATASLVDGPASRLALTAAMVDGHAGVAWRFTRGRLTGLASAPEVDTSGAATIALNTGDMQRADPARVLAAAATTIPEAVTSAVAGLSLRAPPWRAGNRFVAVSAAGNGGAGNVLLHRLAPDGSEAAQPIEIASNPPGAVRAAGDGRHLIVAATNDDTKQATHPYRWSLYDVADGRLLGRFDAVELSAAFCVVDDTLIYDAQPQGRITEAGWRDEARKLVALDVATGRLLWQKTLRDTAYRGTHPPRAPAPTAPSP